MSVSRRDFLRLAGAAGVANLAAAQAARASAAGPANPEWMGMLTDLTLCVGCRKCEWACRQANGLAGEEPIDAYDDPSVFANKRRTSGLSLTVVNRYGSDAAGEKPVHVKTQCMHCIEPACASACLVGAYRKSPQGPVIYDDSACIGCRYCLIACPFEMPAYTYDDPLTPVVRKCMMCVERIRDGASRPACAEMCPVEAITFGKRNALLTLARKKIAEHPDKYVDHIYGETEAGGTCWLYIAGKPFEELGFRTDVGTTPYPELTRGFLSSVPLIQTIWPALLMGAYAFTQRRETLARDSGASVAPPTENGSEKPESGRAVAVNRVAPSDDNPSLPSRSRPGRVQGRGSDQASQTRSESTPPEAES
ncbi:MAG: 4Fe-4S dicluster domain-containing protein [Phycisphaerae bacterium]|nr:4Fe-4S dicluster domain-containing protein [Phycisphaerae bacterium]NUQ46761.1 4Fe-4S dicluster domain-containing protein [Phycisphaerae bacterium]